MIEIQKEFDMDRATVYCVSIAFGHHRCDGEPLPARKIAEAELQALHVFSRAFGGAQLQRHLGGHRTAQDDLIVELCSTVLAYTPAAEGHLSMLWALAGQIAAALEQESVLLTITRVNGLVRWIGPTQPIHGNGAVVSDEYHLNGYLEERCGELR